MVGWLKFNIIEKIPFMVHLEIQCITFKTETSFIAHPWIKLSVVGLEVYSAHDWRAATSVQRAPVTWREWGLWSWELVCAAGPQTVCSLVSVPQLLLILGIAFLVFSHFRPSASFKQSLCHHFSPFRCWRSDISSFVYAAGLSSERNVKQDWPRAWGPCCTNTPHRCPWRSITSQSAEPWPQPSCMARPSTRLPVVKGQPSASS